MKEILEPMKEYKQYQERFDSLIDSAFDELVKMSQINVEQNRETVERYNHADKELRAERKKLSTQRGLKSFLIFLSVVGGLAIVVGGLMLYTAISNGSSLLASILTLVSGPIVMLCSILPICLVINKKIKALRASVQLLKQNADSILNEAWEQMEALNKLFDGDITNKMVNSLDTVIQLDRYYSVLHEVYLNRYFKLPYFSDNDSSTVNMIVGTIADNPFVISREFDVEMGTKTYEGFLVVSWTETRRDSNGKTYTTTRTQTLVATVTKPCPYYGNETFLVYGNESAPNLNFTRKPQAKGKDDKQIERMVKRGEKKLSKIAEKDFKHGDGSFVAMSDTEFDILFGAFDRDNENQFRLLFTPLAQRNMIDLIKDSPYDDDFYFVKKGKLNTILSHHGDTWNMLAGRNFESYSVDIARDLFTNYNKEFFKNMYFMLAPLLCIPLYQQYKPNDMAIDLSAETNIAAREAEMMANILPREYVAPKGSSTACIHKVKYMPSMGLVDNIVIYSYAYATIARVDLVPRVAGNGRMYSVPVHWDEYIPVSCTTEALIFDANGLSQSKYAELMSLLKNYDTASDTARSAAIAECCGVIIVVPQVEHKVALANKINELLKDKETNPLEELRKRFVNAANEMLNKKES